MMGELTVLEEYKEAQKDAIDPAIFGIGTTQKEIGGHKYKTFKASLYNGFMLLSKHPRWQDQIKYCQFENTIHVGGQSIQPESILDVIIWIAGTYRVNFEKSVIGDILLKIAKENQYHSLLEKLQNGFYGPKNAKWDQTKRIDEFLYRYLGVKITNYDADDFEGKTPEQQKEMDLSNAQRKELIFAYSRKMFLSLMARLLWARIGSDVDVHSILCIYGTQGLGKGFCLKALCLEDRYFSNTSLDMRSKDAPLKLRAKMIYELAELAKRSKDIEVEKAFITDAKDTAVLKYEKYSSELPRQCIFVATTNKLNILRDATGSRRWWPIIAGETFAEDETIDIDAIKKIAPQLWHEALHILTEQKIEHEGIQYTAKEAIAKKIPGYEDFIWWLTPSQEKERVKDRKVFISVHPWRRIIEDWMTLTLKIPDINNDYVFYKNSKKEKVKFFVISDYTPIYEELDIAPNKRRHTDREQIDMVLTGLGFFKKRWRFDGRRQITSWAKELQRIKNN